MELLNRKVLPAKLPNANELYISSIVLSRGVFPVDVNAISSDLMVLGGPAGVDDDDDDELVGVFGGEDVGEEDCDAKRKEHDIKLVTSPTTCYKGGR